ncbi:MAG: DUF748 domain-containing protein [SAR324 cluster bacterium]|nr:DUF748 domain-containing protein [SAR324 cluster bacterium]
MQTLKNYPYKRWHYVVGALFSLFLLYGGLGTWGVPPLLKPKLVEQLEQTLKRPVSLGEIRFNPFVLSFTLKNLTIQEADASKSFIQFDELFVNVQSSSALWGALILDELKFTGLAVHLAWHGEKHFNFSDLLPAEPEKTEEPAVPSDSAEKEFLFSIKNIQLINSRIVLTDTTKNREHAVESLQLIISQLSNFPGDQDLFVQTNLSAALNQAKIRVQSKSKIFHPSQKTEASLEVQQIALPDYMEYVPVELNFDVASGVIHGSSQISFSWSDSKKPLVELSAELGLDDLKIVADQQTVLELPSAQVTLLSSEPLEKKIHVGQIALNDLFVNIERESSGQLNLFKLIPKKESKSQTKGSEATAAGNSVVDNSTLQLQVDQFQLSKGRITFLDQTVFPYFMTEITPIDLRVASLQTQSDIFAKVNFVAQTKNKEAVTAEGQFSLEPLTWQGSVQISQVDLKQYVSYYQKLLRPQLTSGVMDVRSFIHFRQEDKKPNVQLSDLAVQLDNLKLLMPGATRPILDMPHVSIAKAKVDLSKQEMIISRVHSNDAKISVILQKDDTINWEHLLQPSPESKKAKGSASESSSPPWRIYLQQGQIENYTIDFHDSTLSKSFNFPISKINLELTNFTTHTDDQPAQLELSMLLNQNRFTAKGSFGISPLRAQIRLELMPLPLSVLQPYVPESIKLLITSGKFSTKGIFSLASVPDSSLPQMTYQGEMKLKDLVTVESGKNKDFLKWENFQLTQLDAGFNPFYLNIDQVSLEGVDLPITLYSDGTNNLGRIFVGMESKPNKEAVQQSKKTKERFEPPQINIRKATFSNGNVRFLDHNLKPSYTANLQNLEGSIFGLTEIYDQPAKLLLKGSYNSQAPLQVVGIIHPLREKLFLDFEIKSKGIDMSSFSSYSGHYLGYAIQKGQLSLDLKYKVSKNRIKADNKIFLDQFTLGGPVKSEKATSLPIKLALAVLKDRNGEIHLDLPIKGDLDDPEFSVGKIVWQTLLNLIDKVATAPFTMLGNMLGEKEEINLIGFLPGQFELDAKGQNKLAKVANALQKRPQLDLEIEGIYDVVEDRKVLQQQLIDRRLRLEKQKNLLQQGKTGIHLEEIVLTPQERETYLTKLHTEVNGNAPASVPLVEMEKWLSSQTPVTTGDLKRLAQQRALRVRSFFIEEGKIPSERIFLTAIRKTDDPAGKASHNRVELRLK